MKLSRAANGVDARISLPDLREVPAPEKDTGAPASEKTVERVSRTRTVIAHAGAMRRKMMAPVTAVLIGCGVVTGAVHVCSVLTAHENALVATMLTERENNLRTLAAFEFDCPADKLEFQVLEKNEKCSTRVGVRGPNGKKAVFSAENPTRYNVPTSWKKD